MGPVTVGEIACITGGTLICGDADFKIDTVSTDSRTASEGSLFIPLKGDKFDGHDFIHDAVTNRRIGAFLTEKDIDSINESKVAIIKVSDTLKALQDMALYNRKKLNIPVIAITGSTGKTTTKDMISSVLSTKYKTLATEGNLNNEIGLPLTLLRLNSSHEMAVVELGMNQLGEIHRLASISIPDVAIITNIGLSHIGMLKSQKNIFKAKMEIFDYFHDGCMAILNGDDPYLRSIEDSFEFPILYIGIEDGNSYLKAYDIEVSEDGISYYIDIGDKNHRIELSIPGIHNVYNSMFAIAVGLLYEVDMENIKRTLYNFKPGEARLNIFTIKNDIKVIDDVYNANPASMRASLSVLGTMIGRRKIAILGDMLELGSYSKEAHMEIGRVAVQEGVDILITVGDDSKYIAFGAKEAGLDDSKIKSFSCNKDVIQYLDTIITAGDTILIKGSRGMKMEYITNYLRERS
ncbi:MAG TPA: UDP-N-acetylmuramoyl-tripeptide--D-alanyl-D-alanine ligase [Clostridiales bacterium]|nr:UDP-N-acetylmuramoyl-tripeptide--D-alanyl-D-alanine ligase [Clostridiales bacterium]